MDAELLIPLVLCALGGSAWASDADCRSAAASGDLATAEVACRACDDAFCRGRLEWLDRRRDPDGGLAGATALERARRGGGDLEQIAENAEFSVVVRADAACVLARAAPPAEAWRLLEPWLPLRGELPEEVRRPLVSLAARALVDLGRDDEARALNAEVLPAGRSEVDVAVRGRRERATAWVVGAGVGGFALAILPSAWRRREVGVGGLLLVAFAALAAGIAWAWDAGAEWPVVELAAALLPLHLLCAAAAGTSPGVAFRVGAFASTLGLSWLVLWAGGNLPW